VHKWKVLYSRRWPTPPLDQWIDHFWEFSDVPSHARETIVPSGTFELVINLDQDEIRIYESPDSDRCRRYAGAVVSGAFSRSFIIDTREHAAVMGVHFRPGGAFPFLDAPADALMDAHVELEALWSPSAAGRLRQQLCAASTPGERFLLLEDALRAHFFRPLQRRRAVDLGMRLLGRREMPVADVANQIGFSHRRFIEIFKEEVGMTPKLFSRIRRFQEVLTLAQVGPAPEWATLALACDYFDQAHLIRDFLQFAGMSPAEYLRRRSGPVKDGHIALPEDGSNFSNTAGSNAGRLRPGGSHA
jgi:AraC-like DNA-binding protein